MSEEPVLLILSSSLSMRSVGIWKACQSSRAHKNHSNNSSANTRKKDTVEENLQDMWTVKQGRGRLRRQCNRWLLRQMEGRGGCGSKQEVTRCD